MSGFAVPTPPSWILNTMTSRKLQAEIEKVLKKITEGVEIFEGIFSKIQTATTLVIHHIIYSQGPKGKV